MKLSFLFNPIFLSAVSSVSLAASEEECKTVTPLADFDEAQYTSAEWYALQQRTSPWFPENLFNCVTAEYSTLDPTLPFEAPGIANGFSIKVYNVGQDVDGNVFTSDDPIGQTGEAVPSPLCAGQSIFPDNAPSEFTVGFCVVPAVSFQQSNYWVLAYDEEDGYALIAGGQTDVPTQNGLCTYSSPTSGLWIFSRSPETNEAMIEKYRGVAIANGIDPSIMLDVNHEGCVYPMMSPAPNSTAASPSASNITITVGPTAKPTSPPTSSSESKTAAPNSTSASPSASSITITVGPTAKPTSPPTSSSESKTATAFLSVLTAGVVSLFLN